MTPHFELMIPGARPAATPLEVRAPYDDALIATADTADSAAVEMALATAHALFRNRAGWLPADRRIEILHNTARLMTRTEGDAGNRGGA